MARYLPDWLVSHFRVALLGEIYPQIRAIAVKYDENNQMLIRYYLDREPTEFDWESADVIAVNLDASIGSGDLIKKLDIECVYHKGPKNEMDPLDGFIYSRREYELEDLNS